MLQLVFYTLIINHFCQEWHLLFQSASKLALDFREIKKLPAPAAFFAWSVGKCVFFLL